MNEYFESDEYFEYQDEIFNVWMNSINLNSQDFYEVDFEKVKTLEDVILLLKSMDMQFTIPRKTKIHAYTDIMHLLKKH